MLVLKLCSWIDGEKMEERRVVMLAMLSKDKGDQRVSVCSAQYCVIVLFECNG